MPGSSDVKTVLLNIRLPRILAGVAMGAVFSAGTAMTQYFADDIRVANIVHRTFGDLGKVSFTEIGLIAGLCLILLVAFMRVARDFNALMNGRDTAASLGVDTEKIVFFSMTVSSLLASLAGAFVGTIGFIGLIGPHIARLLIGTDHRFLLPAAAITGSSVLVLAEWTAKTVMAPVVLPIGALTSFLGAPIFLWLIFRRRNAAWS